MTEQVPINPSDIEKLYEYGESLNATKDKSKNVKDYEGIIKAARGSVKAKQLAAQLIPKFFTFFPSLAAQAFEAYLDLCEEEELGIRVQAIRGLPLLCKDRPEHVPKIVNILGQLLTADENVERDAVNKALMSLLRQDTKASLTALFKLIEGTIAHESIREQVLSFIRDKVFPIKAELLKPQEEMERHITDLVKQSLQDVTGPEFKMFFDFLRTLSLFGESAPPERAQELTEIIQEQADLTAEFNVSNGDHIDRLIQCLYMAIPVFKRGASNSKFVNYLNKHILPIVHKVILHFPEEHKLHFLKNLAESSPYTAPQDSRQLLPVVVTLLKRYMPRRKTWEETEFTYIECLLFAFHHLANKTPNATNSLCGYKIVTGQPSDRLGEDFSDSYKEFCERLTTVEDLVRVTMKKSNQGLVDHDKAMATAKTEEDNANNRTKKQNMQSGVRACNNILTMTQPLHLKSPSFIGDDKITLSWKAVAKPTGPSTTVAARKRPASTNVSSNAASKRGRGEDGVSSRFVNDTRKGVYRGGRSGVSGWGRGGYGKSDGGIGNQFAKRALNGLFRGGRDGARGRGHSGRGMGRNYQ
ncbi:hypothetical protein IFM89_010871 [Coptis chinensis]|uniref:Apoptosis inhibitor 5 n=1 Tax=Coptis chinensis TaxID=261450 RepID=A0A835LZE1_9MAGN|nr:hypothetical protein IFM89_010871 [Coptis chinensis]